MRFNRGWTRYPDCTPRKQSGGFRSEVRLLPGSTVGPEYPHLRVLLKMSSYGIIFAFQNSMMLIPSHPFAK